MPHKERSIKYKVKMREMDNSSDWVLDVTQTVITVFSTISYQK